MPDNMKTHQGGRETGKSPDQVRRFNEWMASLLEEPVVPTIDEIIETLNILKVAVLAHTTRKKHLRP